MIEANATDLLSFAAALERAPAFLFARMFAAFDKATRDHNSLVVRHLKTGRGIQNSRGDSGIAGTLGQITTGTTLDSLQSRSFTTSRYAKVHELGTVGAGGTMPDITPKNGKFLAIPVGIARTRSRDRGRLGPRADPPGSAGDFPGGKFVRSGTGFVYVVIPRADARDVNGRFLRKGERAKGVVVFVLVRSVAIKPRPWFRPAWDELAPVRSRDFGLAGQGALRDLAAATRKGNG